jgi:predicted nucleic acid-binding protein
MISAVDSSVLLDVLCDDPVHALSSAALLQRARAEGRLVVCECVVAEIRPALSESGLRSFMRDWEMEMVPSTLAVALLAGSHFAAYVGKGGRAGRVLPDFLIGAHARLLADRLLARDRGYLREYFKGLTVLSA